VSGSVLVVGAADWRPSALSYLRSRPALEINDRCHQGLAPARPRSLLHTPSNEYHLAHPQEPSATRTVLCARRWHAPCLLGGAWGSDHHFRQAQQGQSRRGHTPAHSGVHAVYRKGLKP
jgi:hypothetical protein